MLLFLNDICEDVNLDFKGCLHRYTQGGGRGGRGTKCTPSKDFEKFDHKNAIKHENRGPLGDSPIFVFYCIFMTKFALGT